MLIGKACAVFTALVLLAGTTPDTSRGRETSLARLTRQNSTFVLPIVRRDSLLNGLQIGVIQNVGTGSVVLRLRINSGAMLDLAGKGGLSNLTADMLLRGGGGLSAKNVAETIEQLGLTVSVTVTWDSTDIVVGGPSDALSSIFDLLGRLVISPAFDQKEMESVKAARIEALKSAPPDNADLVRRKAIEAVFGSHPYGHPMRGTRETIALITRPDLTYYHNRFYLASNAALMISGDANPEDVTQLARAKLGSWIKGERVPPSFRPPEVHTSRRIFIFDRPDSTEVHAALAQIGLSRRADDYLAAMVMADILSALNSKQANSTRRISVSMRVEPRVLAGPLVITVKSPAEDLVGTLNALIEDMALLQSRPPSIEQLELAKSHLIAAFSDRLRSPHETLDSLLDVELYGLGRDYLINFTDRVNAVTTGDVQRAAQKHLSPQTVAVAVAGPANKLQEPLKGLGPVTVLK
ncbi:MAG TPA: pitrilysin family protein [Blastocatellia bacterium]|nr:pitrilysin family protein [Blastocatellia bacterium]